MTDKINCMIVSVIKNTLSMCDYKNCSDVCENYLMEVGAECEHIFNNDVYTNLWITLMNICLSTASEQVVPLQSGH